MDTTTEEDEQKPPPQSTSLFPISTAATAVGAPASQWLRNASFAADLSAVNDAVSSRYNADILKAVTEEEADEEEREEPKKPFYEVLESSESERERRKIKKKKKKKKRKRVEEDETVSFRYGARKSGVRAWESLETKPSKDYYFDSRGDQDNLEFGCLYRMDVARYKLYDSSRESEHSCQAYSRSNHRGLLTEGELDVDALDSKLKSNGRYWSAKFLALEHQRNSKRVRILAPENPIQSMSDDFIPIADESGDRGSLYGTSVIEESWEDEVLRRTKEFNKMTREHPHNVTVWLEFAGFQDKVASMQPQKGARLQTIEKKISILEKAVELNPDDEDLILSLLKTYQGRDSMDALIGRWEKVLMQHSESCKLWREFLRLVHGDFSMFKVSELRKLYAHAIQALSAACRKRNRQLQPAADPTSDAALIELELGMVDVFLNLCRFEWQAGYQELATALFQAEIEYALFCPSLQLTEPGKLRLFEHFWSGNGARIGEDGALGWSTWLEKEEENRQKIVAQMSANEDEHGGWTGWFIPSSEDKEDLEKMADTDVGFTDIKDEAEDENVKQEEDDETLLRMLGIDVDAEATGEVKDTATWVRWAEEESARDRDQWMPLHANSGEHHSVETMDADGEDQLSRVVLFEDVSDYLFSLSSTEARLSFLLQFIDFFDGQIPHCICTNTLSWTEKVLSLEELPASILQYLRRVDYALSTTESGSSILSLEILLRRPDNAAKRISVMKFLRNAILLCLTAFPRNYKLEEALLVAEEQIAMGNNTSQFTATPCQALAKRLLKSDRQDVLLCGIYARREAAFGNIEHARKVFDMALASINGLPRETQSFAGPILFFWFSEMELSNNPNGQSMSRVLHILSCLGNGISYTPFKAQPSSVQILRARQGFKDQINTVRSFWACGNIDDSSVALICSAALFEELTTGWETGVKVISDGLAMVLPERKGQSYQIEFLFNFYVTVLQKHHREAKLSKMLHSVLSGLQIYPTNPGLFASLVELGHLYSVPNKLRWILDDFCQKKTSVIVWLFALLFELGRGDSRHRIRRLFERALVNETLRSTPLLWRCYIAYEVDVAANLSAARRIFFRAIHACPWSKKLWLDGFKKLNTILTAKELSDLQEVMRDKELNLRTDIYEILLQDEHHPHS